MSKTCQNCGNIFEDDTSICPRCGTQYIAIQAAQPEHSENSQYQSQPQQPYGQPYGQQQYQQPQYMPPQQPTYQTPAEQPMGVGSWLATILLTSLFGIISLVLLFIWAFGNDVPTAKKNYCRAMLILEAIGVVLGIIFVVIFIAVLSSSGVVDNISDFINQIEGLDIEGLNI